MSCGAFVERRRRKSKQGGQFRVWLSVVASVRSVVAAACMIDDDTVDGDAGRRISPSPYANQRQGEEEGEDDDAPC